MLLLDKKIISSSRCLRAAVTIHQNIWWCSTCIQLLSRLAKNQNKIAAYFELWHFTLCFLSSRLIISFELVLPEMETRMSSMKGKPRRNPSSFLYRRKVSLINSTWSWEKLSEPLFSLPQQSPPFHSSLLSSFQNIDMSCFLCLICLPLSAFFTLWGEKKFDFSSFIRFLTCRLCYLHQYVRHILF